MTAISSLARTFAEQAKVERRHNTIGRMWQNLPPISSYAGERGYEDIDPAVTRKKQAVTKAWPELGLLLDEIASTTPRL